MPVPSLETLPPPPPGKTGWPWTVATSPAPATAPGARPWPRVTVVTPSYNQGHFLEETIRSVLLQGYPNLEYIVMDGGSRDNSVDVIRNYAPFLAYWTTGRDRGQSDAINQGFRKSTGEWTGWQNSDDYYEPNALITAAATALAHPDASVVYGSVQLCDAESKFTGAYPTSDFDPLAMLPWANMFNQSMFFHRRVFDAGFFLDESMHHYIDHDLFWRLIFAGHKFRYAPALSAVFRLHDAAKGSTQFELAANELYALYLRVHDHPTTPPAVRRRALICLRNHCIDQFGKSRWPLFEKFVADLKSRFGLRGLGANLALRRLVTRLGVANIDRVRRVKHLIRKPHANGA
jgi:glycosyltransferase involved in cell wall biosynthesis